jgi:hypothetical protein
MRRRGFRGNRDVGAVTRGTQRDRETDAAAGAGDEEGFAFQIHRRFNYSQFKVQSITRGYPNRLVARGKMRGFFRGLFANGRANDAALHIAPPNSPPHTFVTIDGDDFSG